jgi:outer membrane protein, heavy metal efflux system
MSRTNLFLGLPWRACVALVCASLMAIGGASAQTQWPAPPPVLPPAHLVMQVLAQAPQVRAATAGVSVAQARRARLDAGPHDWVAKAGTNRRQELQGSRSVDAEVGLETGVRWPAKVAVDRQLGLTENSLASLALADTWHEAARALLSDWFDALRDLRQASVLQAQVHLAMRQLAATQQRVSAGEAAPLELYTVKAELARLQAQAGRAQAQAQMRLGSLQRLYPGLPAPDDLAVAGGSIWPGAFVAHEAAASEWATTILADNHALALGIAKSEQARLQATRTALERHGDLTLGVRASRERSGQENVFGVYVSMPLGSTGRQADTRAALAQADMAEQVLVEQRRQMAVEAWRTASALLQAGTTRAQLQHAQVQTERSAALQIRAYELGESPLTEVLLARRSALEAQLAADTAVLDDMQAHAGLLVDAHRLWAAPESVH